MKSTNPTISDVKSFWESNPLWTGELRFQAGTREFFDEHTKVVIDDCFAGEMEARIFPDVDHRVSVLDLGCGPGFWTIQLGKRCENVTAADLTERALQLTQSRCAVYGINAVLSQQNAEQMSFAADSFDHVNCQGVIHHTPKTDQCVSEIARVLKPGGTATISVYYLSPLLQLWPVLAKCGIGTLARKLGFLFAGRGRESIFQLRTSDEIVRLYDGAENPIGKAYSRSQFIQMLSPYFKVEETYLHYFPARILPFSLGKSFHRFLDRNFGFMIFAKLTKK